MSHSSKTNVLPSSADHLTRSQVCGKVNLLIVFHPDFLLCGLSWVSIILAASLYVLVD